MEGDTRPTVCNGSVLAAEAGPDNTESPPERTSSFHEAPREYTQGSRPPLSQLPRSTSLKDGSLSEEDDEEKVCRVCCCAEPDQDGEDALAVLGINSHVAILQEQFHKREEQRRRRSASLSRSSTRALRGQEGQVLCSNGRGSFRGLAADLARRIFQKEDAAATPAREGAELKRTRSLSSAGLPPPVPACRPHLHDQEAQPPLEVDASEGGPVSEHVVDMPATAGYSRLLPLECHCQGDLALCHYACFLRWVVSRETAGAECDNKCEICGQVRAGDCSCLLFCRSLIFVVANGLKHTGQQTLLEAFKLDCDFLFPQPALNISQADIDTINKALRRRRQVMALAAQQQQQQEPTEAMPQSEAQVPALEPSLNPPALEEGPFSLSDGEEQLEGADSEARVAAAAWFDPLNRGAIDRNRRLGQVLQLDRPATYLTDAIYPMTRSTKVVVEVLGVLLATALLTLTLSRLLMDVLSHSEISFGLHYILASIISLIVVLWFRIVAIPRLRSGPARSGAVVMCVWLMVLGVWFSGTKPSDKN